MPTNKFASGVAVVPVLHPSGAVHNVEVPEDTDLASIHSSLTDAGYAHPAFDQQQPTREGALENQDFFREQAQKAWMKIQNGKAHAESAFGYNKDNSVNDLGTSPDEANRGHLSLQVNKNTFAILHTHNDHLNPEPSPGDIASAKKSGIPIYVASRKGLYVIRPSDGAVTQVFNSPDWMMTKPKGK